MIKYFTLILLTITLLSSCGIKTRSNFSTVKIGMSQEQVVKQLGKNYEVVAAKKYDDGVLEIYQYLTQYETENSPAKYNWLFFFNNKLEEWGPRENFQPYDYFRPYEYNNRINKR